MIRVANLRVDPVAIELMPESIARENCVLPIRVEGGTLNVVLGRRTDVGELIDKLRFILDRPIVCAVADREHVERAIDEVYSMGGRRGREIAPSTSDFPAPVAGWSWSRRIGLTSGPARDADATSTSARMRERRSERRV